MSDSILDRLASKSKVGQDSGFSGPKIPTIRLDGSGAGETAGQIMKFTDDGAVSLGNKLSLQIIRIRKKLMQGGELTKFFSEEYDSSTSDQITLKMSTRANDKEPWGKPTVVATGTASEIRGTQPVKVVSIVYGILGDTIVKLTVKGASTTGDDGLYDYLNSFGSEHVFQFETNITVSLVQKNRAISYHRMHFSKGAKMDNMETVEQYLDLIEGTPEVKVAKPTDDNDW